MTEQQQRAASAELAQRIGWREGEFAAIWFPPDGNLKCVQADPPNYFTDPVASRELVLWLAKQERSIQREFVFALREATDEADLCYELRLLTAHLPVIARAACKALGIEVSE
jgi:predicted metal-binding protein